MKPSKEWKPGDKIRRRVETPLTIRIGMKIDNIFTVRVISGYWISIEEFDNDFESNNFEWVGGPDVVTVVSHLPDWM